MILPSLPRPPPPSLPLSSSSSFFSATLWPLNALDLSSGAPSPASTRRVDSTEGRYGSQALLIPSVTCRLGLPAVRLSSPSPMAPSVRCSPELPYSSKRLRKALEVSNCRSRMLLPESNQIRDLRFRVSAVTRHGRSELSGVELELTDDDGLRKRKAPVKVKSPEELHFEAIEQYWLRYENEDYGSCNGDGRIVGVKADAASLEDMHSPVLGHSITLDGDLVNTPIYESKYFDASRALPRHEVSFLSTGCETLVQKIPSCETGETRISSIGNDGPKKHQAKPGNVQSPETPQHIGSVPKIRSGETSRTFSLDESHDQKKLDEEEVPHIEKCQFENNASMSEADSTNSGELSEVTEEQRIRMELNKAAALARRNMRICEDAVAEAQATGLAFPKFESLLVEKSWVEALKVEFQKPYMERLHHFVSQEATGRIPIYPPPAKLFNAFNSCPLDKVKVVIIGQDPYHSPGQAMGLCFSVEKSIKLPSSLRNIFLEIQSDLDCEFPTHGNLEKWAYQGVLLLNTVLTVRDRHPNSHAKKGWELFTDAAIRTLAQQRSGVVFLLWGNQAQEKLRLINKTCHHILKAFHPSGISAHRGFFKCRHFSKTNQLLVDQGLLPIDWQL